MGKSKKIILFGIGDLARIAKLYFERDTEYQPVCFTVDREYLFREDSGAVEIMIDGLPVVPYDLLPRDYPPSQHEAHVCVVYDNLNRARASICRRMEDDGYRLASYISPHAFIAPTVKLGKHHFIFENNVIQDFVEVGDNAIFWSGNHCGHHSRIGNDVFISSHVVVSGHCHIGNNVFIGVNATLANGVSVGSESWIMHGAVIGGDVPENSFVKTVQSEVVPLNEPALFRALERKKK